MAKYTPDPLANLTNETSVVTKINANLDAISTAIENTVSRNGEAPNAMEADLDLNNQDILNGGTISAEVLTLGGVTITPDSLSGGSTIITVISQGGNSKEAVATATTGAITLSGEQTIDGVLTSASRVLVKNQVDLTENGIYVSAAGAWTRSSDADDDADLSAGMLVYVDADATTNGNKLFAMNAPAGAIVVGTTELTFVEITTPYNFFTNKPLGQLITDYTLILSDAGKQLNCNSSDDLTITIPPDEDVNFSSGTEIAVQTNNTGSVTFVAGSGVSLNFPYSETIVNQYNRVLLKKRGVNTWTITGDILPDTVQGLVDAGEPGADRIAFWDESNGAIRWLEVSTCLTLSGSTLTADATAPQWGQIGGTLSDQTDLQTALDDKQDTDGDLTAIAALAGTSGLLRKTATNAWTLDTDTYLTTADAPELLTADRTYYVRTDGSDSNDGTADTAGGAWLTLQHAWEWVSTNLRQNGFVVTIQVADGTYSAGIDTYNNPVSPTGVVYLRGNPTTPANVHINLSYFYFVNLAYTVHISGFKITGSPGSSLVAASNNSFVYVGTNPGNLEVGGMVFAGDFNVALLAFQQSTIYYEGTMSFVSPGSSVGGIANIVDNSIGVILPDDITFSGTWPFLGSVLSATTSSYLFFYTGSITGGTVTGTRYYADMYSFPDISATPPGDVAGVEELADLFDSKQDVDADLTAIAGLSPSNDDIIQRKSGAWTNRTMSELATDLGTSIKPTESFIIAASDETTAITTGNGKVTFRMPYAFTLTAVRASCNTAPTGSTIIIDINESGTTILSTKLSIDASEKTSTTAASAAVISDTSLADDAEITIDFDQVGSSVAGTGVKVYLIGRRT